MAAISPSTTGLELVQQSDGRLHLMQNGSRVQGVVKIEISQDQGGRPIITVQIHAVAVRFTTVALAGAEITDNAEG